MSVDLPAPFSPTMACMLPRATERSTPSLATTRGYLFTMPLRETANRVSGIGLLEWDFDLAGDDGLASLLGFEAGRGRDQGLVVRVVNIIDSLFLESKLFDLARQELPFLGVLDRLENGLVDLLGDRGEHEPRRVLELVRIHADGQCLFFARGLEDAQTGRAGGGVDDVGALFVLAQGQFFSLGRVLEGVGSNPGVSA